MDEADCIVIVVGIDDEGDEKIQPSEIDASIRMCAGPGGRNQTHQDPID